MRLKTDLSARLTNLSLRLHLIVSRLFIICYRVISVYMLCVLLLVLLSLSSLLLLLLFVIVVAAVFVVVVDCVVDVFNSVRQDHRERENKVSFPVQSNLDPYSSVQTRLHHSLGLFLFIRSLSRRLVQLECTTHMTYSFSVPF